MKKIYLISIILAFLLISLDGYSQRWKSRRYEFYVGMGTSQHYGDIGGSMEANNLYGLRDIKLNFTRPSISLGARYKLNGVMAVKLNLAAGMISGNDKDSKNYTTRNYSYKSTIFESSVHYEYYLLSEVRDLPSGAIYNRKGMIHNFFNIHLYAFTGFGCVYSNPTVLDSMGVQVYKDYYNVFKGDKFPKMGLVFPVGLGVKYVLSNELLLGAEFGRRITTADYIDGYSSRYSTHNDLYDFLTISLIYRIPTDRRGRPILDNAREFRL